MVYKLQPHNKLDAEEVMRMAALGCTASEIAQKFAVSANRVMDEYRQEYLQGLSMMHENLRNAQFECAYNSRGNATMLIFLGKVYLKQQEVYHDEKVADLDILIKLLDKKAKEQVQEQDACLISQQSN